MIVCRLAAISISACAYLATISTGYAECLDPIPVKVEGQPAGLRPDRTILRFEPVDKTVCLPLIGGGCREVKERRVAVALDVEMTSSSVHAMFESQTRKSLAEQGYIPDYEGLDTSVGGFSISPTSSVGATGRFGFHAEKWWKTDGFCCRGLRCSRCDWKTRVWERTTDVSVFLSTAVVDDGKRFTMSSRVELDKSATWLERLAGGLIFSWIDPMLGLFGPALTDFLVGEFLKNIERAISIPSQDSGNPESYLKGQFADARTWAKMKEKLGNMRYSTAGSGFLPMDGAWGLRVRLWTDPSLERLIEYRDFCAFVRPLLENQGGAENKFQRAEPTVVRSIGNNDRLVEISPNESLWKVAARNYRNPYLYGAIVSANPGVVASSGLVRKGASIRVPSIESIVNSGYLIGRGDSLWKISASKFGDGKMYPLIVSNNVKVITKPNLIFPFWAISIPVAKTSSEVRP